MYSISRRVLYLFSAFLLAATASARDATAQEAEDIPPFGNCEASESLSEIALAEASGAAWFREDGRDYVLVTSDSGGGGAAGVLDVGSGDFVETRLGLGVIPGDDLEGLHAVGADRIAGITSAGYLRVWRRDGLSFELVQEARAISDEQGWVCEQPRDSNCERNYEGICFHPAPSATGCRGYVASKSDGRLYCLIDVAGRVLVRPDVYIDVTGAGRLTGCAYAPDAPWDILASVNALGLNRVYRISDYDSPSSEPTVSRTEMLGAGFLEALAVVPDGVILLSDTGGSPSRVRQYRCTP